MMNTISEELKLDESDVDEWMLRLYPKLLFVDWIVYATFSYALLNL